MTHKIVQLEPMRMAGYLLQTTMTAVTTGNNPIPAFWGEVMQDGRFGKLMELGSDCPCSYGACVMHTEEDMDYTISIALSKGAQAPEGYHIVNIPAGEYMVVETTLENLHAAYGYANGWLAESGYTWAHGTSFEMYGADHAQTQLLHLHIPIMEL